MMIRVLIRSLLRAIPKKVRTLVCGSREVRTSISRERFMTRFPGHTFTATFLFFHLALKTAPKPPWPMQSPTWTSLMSITGLVFAFAPLYMGIYMYTFVTTPATEVNTKYMIHLLSNVMHIYIHSMLSSITCVLFSTLLYNTKS